MCVLATLEQLDLTDLEPIHRVLLALTRQIPDRLHAQRVGQGNSQQ